MNVALLMLNGLLVAATYVVARAASLEGVAPAVLLFWQASVAAVVVGIVARVAGEPPDFSPAFLRYYLIAGALGFSLPYFTNYLVLETLPAGIVGIAGSLTALLSWALARATGDEPPNPRRLAGLLLGLAGVLAIVLPRSALPSPELAGWALLAFAVPLSLAAGNVYRTRAWPPGGRPLGMAAGLLATQAILVAPFGVAAGALQAPGAGLSAGNLAIAGVAAISSVFYVSAFELQKRASPAFVGQMGYVVTLGTLAAGIAFLGERHSPWVWLAVAAILGGLGLASLARQPARALPALRYQETLR